MNNKKDQNGYVNLNGVIIQWGTTGNIGKVTTTVTLPTAFTATNYSVVTTLGSANIGNSEYINTQQIKSRTTTSFSMYKGTGESTPVHWVAAGY